MWFWLRSNLVRVGLIVLFIPLELIFVSIYVLIDYLLFCGYVVLGLLWLGYGWCCLIVGGLLAWSPG